MALATAAAPDASEEQSNPFDALEHEQLADIAAQLGIELQADPQATPPVADDEEEGAGEAAAEDDEEEGAPSSKSDYRNALDPGVLAKAAVMCAEEAASYAAKLDQLAEQVGAHDPKSAKKISALGKKAQGLADDAQKAADKASKAAEGKKLGAVAESAQVADEACAEVRALVDEAKKLVGGADLPEDDEPAAPAEKAPPGRSAIEDWADSMLG